MAGSEVVTSDIRMRGKRGPELRYQVKGIYFLPPSTPFPLLKRDHETVSQHMENGYGFPQSHFENGKFKKVSFPANTTNAVFKDFLRGLYPQLTGNFTVHIVTKRRLLEQLPSGISMLSWLRSQGTKGYQGVLVIKQKQTETSSSDNEGQTEEDLESTTGSETALCIDTSPEKVPVRSRRRRQKPVRFQSHTDSETDPAPVPSVQVLQSQDMTASLVVIKPEPEVPSSSSASAPDKVTKDASVQVQKRCLLEADVDNNVLQRWSEIGVSKDLKTNAEIASYLVNLHASVKNGAQVSLPCASCQTPLVLFCTKCPAPGFDIQEVATGDGDDACAKTTKSETTVLEHHTPGENLPSVEDDGTDNGDEDTAMGELTLAVSEVSSTRGMDNECASPSSGSVQENKVKHTPRVKAKSSKRKSGSSDYACEVCGKTFTAPCLLREHSLLHTGEKPHVCKVCNAAFRVKRQLKQHELAKHTDQRPYLCPYCGQSFNLVGSLNMHIQRHKAKKSFICSICGSSFYANAHLVAHQRVHTDDRPYPCSECGFAFREKSKLKEHMRIHTGEKPFKCTICPAAFGRKKNLVGHIRRHNSDKPYKCNVCNYACVDAGILKVHSRTHTGEKPYVCKICGAAFAYNVTLRNHIRHHTDREMYKCDKCGVEFKYYKELVKHKQSEHTSVTVFVMPQE